MKSKKMIELLKKLDPSGELEVCSDGNAIIFLERLPGYYDGAYHYVEESEYYPEKYYISTEGEKIVIKTLDVESYISDKDGEYDSVILNMPAAKIEHYTKKFEKISRECKEEEQREIERNLFCILKKIQEGYQIIYCKNEKLMFYVMGGSKCQCDKSNLNDDQLEMNVLEKDAVQKSGLFEPFEKENHTHFLLTLRSMSIIPTDELYSKFTININENRLPHGNN